MKGVVVMMKKDEQINKLFDDYAEQLAPREELSSKARAEMAASDGKKSSSSRKRSGWLHLLWIMPVWIVFALSLALVSRVIFGHDGNGNLPGAEDIPQTVDYYTFADVFGKRVQPNDANEYAKVEDCIKVSALKQRYEVVSERYYVFYAYGDKQPRYIKAYLALRSADGVFTELELIAEYDGYVRSDLKEVYECVSDNKIFVWSADFDQSGEYVTKGYFAARGAHFYVVGRNGQPSQEVCQIISEIM